MAPAVVRYGHVAGRLVSIWHLKIVGYFNVLLTWEVGAENFTLRTQTAIGITIARWAGHARIARGDDDRDAL